MCFCIIAQYNVLSYRRWVGYGKLPREALFMTDIGMYLKQQTLDRYGTAVLTVWGSAFWLFSPGTGKYNKTSIHCTSCQVISQNIEYMCKFFFGYIVEYWFSAHFGQVMSKNIYSVHILVRLHCTWLTQCTFLLGYTAVHILVMYDLAGQSVTRMFFSDFNFGVPLKTMREQRWHCYCWCNDVWKNVF